VLAGIGLGVRERGRRLVAPALIVGAVGLILFLLTRAFSDGGRYPFSVFELVSILLFCGLGGALTWRVERAQTIRWIFVAYGLASIITFAIASPLGENIARVRFAALPIAVLVLSLRSWRPLPVAAVALVLAASWNLSPHAWSFSRATVEPTAHATYWQPAVDYLQEHLSPSYRVEAVDTAGHWAAVYLPEAGIPLTRGWFRQDDFPQNEVLYDQLNKATYQRWLRHLGVKYVVLTDAPTDYSSKDEARLIRSGRSGLVRVMEAQHLTVFSVPRPRPLLTGAAPAEVLALAQTYILLHVDAAGRYRLAVRYSPYWSVKGACVYRGKDGMIRLIARRPGRLRLRFAVGTGRALATVVGNKPAMCVDTKS
jgi:hypothetical protein